LWAEYAKTLHMQTAGESRRVYATVLAKAIFSEVALVDTPLRVEFYRHLPGILTGLGIIGTFFTLIIGLGKFQVQMDPLELQKQLQELINQVREAFFVSGVAVFFAMFVTFLEKTRINKLYRKVSDLALALDSLYAGGIGEEYLARLVAAVPKRVLYRPAS
jgi:putative membrane protein